MKNIVSCPLTMHQREDWASLSSLDSSTSSSLALMKKFTIPTFTKEINELRSKLESNRWPLDFESKNQEYGVEGAQMMELVVLWKEFDWDLYFTKLNLYSHYLFEFDGISLHFVHIKSKCENATPLMLIHGWPGSFLEFWDIIDQLMEFDIVIPSLPGYGFSSSQTRPGCTLKRIGMLFHELMMSLGYTSYMVQGGDWGSMIARAMAIQFPRNIVAAHVNMIFFLPKSFIHTMQIVSAFFFPKFAFLAGLSTLEIEMIQETVQFSIEETGYMLLQATKPNTIQYSLSDSPVGLLAWILEKFHTWGGSSNRSMVFSSQQVLEMVSLYYLTNTIGSSIRLYKESIGSGEVFRLAWTNCVTPIGYTVYPGDIMKYPRRFVASSNHLVFYRMAEKGGHFAAMEDAAGLANDIRCTLMNKDQPQVRNWLNYVFLGIGVGFVFHYFGAKSIT
jgi:microsomal epoxide hydrolase